MTRAEEINLDIISASAGVELTQEQKEFAADFRTPILSFSDPGTGKTASTSIGLIQLQGFHGVPGNKIRVVSFTNEATNNIAGRYSAICKERMIPATVKFSTFHSFTLQILKKAYPNMQVKGDPDYAKNVPYIADYIQKLSGSPKDNTYARQVLDVINLLNSRLAFAKGEMELSYAYKKLNMDFDMFQKIRYLWFKSNLAANIIFQGDIPLYALYGLLRFDGLAEQYRSMTEVMVVDEFQDMSLLYLKIMQLVANNAVCIGDIKQQIYQFNGASDRIVDEFKKAYPSYREIALTHSFRCKSEIAIFSSFVYHPNDENTKEFIGVSEGGEVILSSNKDFNIDIVTKELKTAYENWENEETRKDVMFLFRNNFSSMPITERLWQNGIPFRMSRYMKVMDFPILSDFCSLINIVAFPEDAEKLQKGFSVFPEFRYSKINSGTGHYPIVDLLLNSKKDITDLNYRFIKRGSYQIVAMLNQIKTLLSRGARVIKLFEVVYPIYAEEVINNNWWKYDKPYEYYAGLASEILMKKDYYTMYSEEIAKAESVAENMAIYNGVRCYTIHMAKGLEADEVYLLDANEDVFPNVKKVDKLIAAGCEYEAAKTLREDINLLFVAASRARTKFAALFRETMTPLLLTPNNHKYSYLQEVYKNTNLDFDNVAEFYKLMKVGE